LKEIARRYLALERQHPLLSIVGAEGVCLRGGGPPRVAVSQRPNGQRPDQDVGEAQDQFLVDVAVPGTEADSDAPPPVPLPVK
jgi:hypothetical protein